MRRGSNAGLFWPVVTVVAVLDVGTKFVAARVLVPQHVPHDVLGNALRLTLVYNPGAAFGLNVGAQSRWIFTVLSILALVILGRLYRATARGDIPRTAALALVCAGAVGNLLDRLRSDLGVVDFIDVGFATVRWPTFNVADMAVSCGAVLLAWVLWREDQHAAPARAASHTASPTAPPGAPSASSPHPVTPGSDAGDFV